MRDKIVFFVLGAVLATIAYTIGDLETLTAEDEITELDHLTVNRITVKESIVVGDVGTKPILIKSTHELAKIVLLGGVFTKNDDFRKIDNSPAVLLQAKDNGAMLRIESHSERPEAVSALAILNRENTKFESGLILQDSNGEKVIFSH